MFPFVSSLSQLWKADGQQCQETQRMFRLGALRDDRRKYILCVSRCFKR